MRHEVFRRLKDLWGDPSSASKYLSVWSVADGLDVGLETRPPDNIATLWVPWPGPFGTCPPYGEVYAPGRGRNSNTYRCQSLAPGKAALRLRISRADEAEDALRTLAVDGSGARAVAEPGPGQAAAPGPVERPERTCYLRRVEADHLGFTEFTEVFDGEPRRPTLMNFSTNFPRQAATLPDGTRLLVWVRETGRVFADMELIGGLDEGAAACGLHGFAPDGTRHGPRWGQLYRPVRILRRSDSPAGPTIEESARAADVPFRRLQSSMQKWPEAEYERLVAAVAWDYLAPGLASPNGGTDLRDRRPTVPPPIRDAQELLGRIVQSRGLPERNMEELVKEFLVRLGHAASDVIFQIGRIDVMVRGADGTPAMVLEVKRSLAMAKDLDQARRQGFDYAAKTGARFVVLSDADQYEIYDRTAGLDHGSMLKGSFRLTAFRPDDAASLDLLRPRPVGSGGPGTS